ncbi:MAG: hypothetical protein HYY40_01615 [Bacteroidetes bacterium]|nr:hypothetical protein [Bacteroidota bacterium]
MKKNALTKIACLFLLIILGSCSAGKLSKKNKSGIIIYPPPPDTARIQFLTRISSAADISGSRNWFVNFLLGKETGMPILKPYGIAVQKGKIFVCDKGLAGLEIIDLEKRSFDYFIPSGNGKLSMPLGCYADTSGLLYVADAGRLQIVVFDRDGNYVKSIGDTADFKPTDVFVYDRKIWVSNMAGHKIDVYSTDPPYILLNSFTQSEPGKIDYLYSPVNIFVNNEKVFVTDFGDFKIKMFSHDGKFLDTLGTYGINMGQLAKPKGTATDRESNVFVADAAFENVQIFNKEGKLLMFFGGPYKGPGDMWLPVEVVIDYDNMSYFQKYVATGFELKYLIFVSNQFGPDKITVYGRIVPVK